MAGMNLSRVKIGLWAWGAAALSYIAVFTRGRLDVPFATVETGLAFIAFWGFYFYFQDFLAAPKNKVVACFAAFFAFCMVAGRAYDRKDTIFILFAGKEAVADTVISLLGFFLLSYICMEFLRRRSRFIRLCRDAFVFNRRMKWKVMLFIFLCWLPILWSFFPGSVDHDSFAMLDNWTGERVWNTHHPVIATVWLGLMFDFGKYILHSVSAGDFLIIAVQVAFLLYAVIHLLDMMEKLGTPLWSRISVILYFALCPIFVGFVQCTIKDTMHFIFFMLFSDFFISILMDSSWIMDKKHLMALFLVTLGLLSFRNTGIHLFLLTFLPYLVYLFVTNRKKLTPVWKRYVALCLVVTSLHLVFMGLLVPALGIRKGEVGEMLSIPFQQTARYVKKHPKDMTKWERNAVNQILPVNKIGKLYDSQLSDPVKNAMRNRNNPEKLKNYFRAWASMGVRHPGTYMDATFSNCYGYFYPDSFSRARHYGIKLYIKDKHDKNSPNTGTYDVQYFHGREVIKKATWYLTKFWRSLPILGLCFSTGMYTWICLVCTMLLICQKKYGALLGFLPSLAILLFCVASPVNGYVRYMLPVIATIPLMISWTVYNLSSKRKS